MPEWGYIKPFFFKIVSLDMPFRVMPVFIMKHTDSVDKTLNIKSSITSSYEIYHRHF